MLPDGLFKIISSEGVSRLWSGTVPSLILVSNPAIHFMVYETLKRHILEGRKASEISPLTFFAVGAAAKAIATVITYPLQLVQTKMRVNSSLNMVVLSLASIMTLIYSSFAAWTQLF